MDIDLPSHISISLGNIRTNFHPSRYATFIRSLNRLDRLNIHAETRKKKERESKRLKNKAGIEKCKENNRGAVSWSRISRLNVIKSS